MSFSLRLFSGFLSQKIIISNDPLQQEETYGGKSASFVAILKITISSIATERNTVGFSVSI